jgi:hypothetical protein
LEMENQFEPLINCLFRHHLTSHQIAFHFERNLPKEQSC